MGSMAKTIMIHPLLGVHAHVQYLSVSRYKGIVLIRMGIMHLLYSQMGSLLYILQIRLKKCLRHPISRLGVDEFGQL